MIVTMHGLSTMYCNVVTEIRMAGEAGYEGLEMVAEKLLRYLDAGYKPEDLLPLFKKYNVRPVMINAQHRIERFQPKEREELMKETERLSSVAGALACPTVQLTWGSRLDGLPMEDQIRVMAQNIAEIADIGKKYGVRFQLEPIAFSPVNSLSQCLEIMRQAGRANIGMVIDFWHLWAGGGTTPDDVAKLDSSQIYGIHFCDGKCHTGDSEWDELSLRAFLPGEGDIPVKAWVDAVKSTGFDGVWSCELCGYKYWEMDLVEVARLTKARMEDYVR